MGIKSIQDWKVFQSQLCCNLAANNTMHFVVRRLPSWAQPIKKGVISTNWGLRTFHTNFVDTARLFYHFYLWISKNSLTRTFYAPKWMVWHIESSTMTDLVENHFKILFSNEFVAKFSQSTDLKCGFFLNFSHLSLLISIQSTDSVKVWILLKTSMQWLLFFLGGSYLIKKNHRILSKEWNG